MDLHEHLKMARSKIKPLSKEEKSERGRININKRWDKYKADKILKESKTENIHAD